MIRKIALIGLSLLPANLLSDNNTQLLTFTNPYIHSLDGITFMIDGVAVHDMLVVLRKIMTMQNGHKIGTKITGSYNFDNEQLSVKQLAQVEKENPNDPRLAKTLILAKNDFIETTKHFMKGIEPAKKLLLSLMDEFCERRNRLDSVILTWTHAKNGNEAEVFDHAIKNFADFDLFLQDLTFFLKDLINSCPKAREQYKEWYQKKTT